MKVSFFRCNSDFTGQPVSLTPMIPLWQAGMWFIFFTCCVFIGIAIVFFTTLSHLFAWKYSMVTLDASKSFELTTCYYNGMGANGSTFIPQYAFFGEFETMTNSLETIVVALHSQLKNSYYKYLQSEYSEKQLNELWFMFQFTYDVMFNQTRSIIRSCVIKLRS